MMAAIEFHLQSGSPDQARRLLAQAESAMPNEPRVWWAKATLAQATGDTAQAEVALRRVGVLDSADPLASSALGDLLCQQGRAEEAAAAWRESHRRDPRFVAGTVSLARHLIATGEAADAIHILDASLAAGPHPSFLTIRASAHGRMGDTAAELRDYEAAVAASDAAPLSLYNLAVAQSQAGLPAEAEATVRRALAQQPGTPALLQMLGQVLVARNALDEAQAAFEEAARRDPTDTGVQRDLAALIWTRTGDIRAATAGLDAAIVGLDERDAATLLVAKGRLLEQAGDLDGARAALVPAAESPTAPNHLLCAASRLLLHTDPAKAVTLAARANGRAPNDLFGLATLAEAQLAAGDVDGAERTGLRLGELSPHDQYGIALLATAWRLKGDVRYRTLHDFDTLVRTSVIETPPGWGSRESFLSDLAAALERLRGQVAGAAATHVALSTDDDPAVKALFDAVDGPIRAYMQQLDQGDDPLRGRPHEGGYRLAAAWAMRLSPGPEQVELVPEVGWLSAIFCLPTAARGPGAMAPLVFGRPGTPTMPALEPEFRVEPQPGMLVLFPSYMWRGAEGFAGSEPRLAVTFDVIPA
jgi:tetratricopeptide (TPR) repeat protein